MKERLTFACWNCEESYRLVRDVSGQPKLRVQCPFCDEEAVAELDPYRSPVTDIYRSDVPSNSREETINLPDIIPTREPTAADELA